MLIYLRTPVLFAVLCLFLIPLSHAQFAETKDSLAISNIAAPAALASHSSPLPNDRELAERLQQLQPKSCVQLRATPVVKGYLRTYLVNKPDRARIMLGKRLTYFQLFEQKLKEHGLPADLKYLAVVESALNPTAVSKAGAVGLWQFMPSTGKEYGLLQTAHIDERSDPVRSTDAAARYLKALYRQYNDWALALAAYNSGPGRVNAAIKRARSNNFWQIMNYLPAETRNYVPAFIAASYLCSYFPQHGVQPVEPDFDEQLNTHILVFETLTFSDLRNATGIDYKLIKTLNPGYKRDVIQGGERGAYVVLPLRVMPAFVYYLNSLGERHYKLDDNAFYVNSSVGEGRYLLQTLVTDKPDFVENIAQRYGCYTEHLKAWNSLSGNYLPAGQTLKIWRPIPVLRRQNVGIQAGSPSVNTSGKPRQSGSADHGEQASQSAIGRLRTQKEVPEFVWHTVQRNESLSDIARLYGISIENLLKFNNLSDPGSVISPGRRIKAPMQ